MNKIQLTPDRLMYPRPIYLAGTIVNGKPNFMAVGGGGVANGEPPMICMPIRHRQHTLKGIRENLSFSVNFPSVDLVKEVDYCGIVSGSRVDKVAGCNFHLFYGKETNAPFIEECPVNLGLKVMYLMNLGSHMLVIGQVVEAFASENCLTDGKPDVAKIKPMIYAQNPEQYFAFGEFLAKAHSAGVEIKTRSKP